MAEKFDMAVALMAMDRLRRHKALLEHITYLRTDALNKPVATCRYECTKDWCDMAKVRRCIDKHQALSAYGSPTVFKGIAEDIDTFPEDYLPNVMDGFHIYRSGLDVLRLQRTREDGKGNRIDCSGGRTAFLDYNDVRAETLKWYEQAGVK
jgi:hypothetical protein